MKTKVKVKRAELLKIVEGRLRKAEKDYDRARAAYPDKETAWKAASVERLEKALADAKRGKISMNGYKHGVTLPDKPDRPSEGRELCNLRRMHVTLKLGAEDNILLSQEDADFYFGPCTR